MSTYAFILAILGLIVGTIIFLVEKGSHKKRNQMSDQVIDTLRADMNALRARVETLEKIQTDPTERLRRELEDLEG